MRDYVHETKVLGVTWDDGTSNDPYTSSSTKYVKTHHRGDLIPSDGIIPTPYEAARDYKEAQYFEVWSDPIPTYDRVNRVVVDSVRRKYGKEISLYLPNFAHELPDYLYNNAVINLRRKLSLADFNLGVALAELPESINMIARAVINLYNLIRNIRRWRPIPDNGRITRSEPSVYYGPDNNLNSLSRAERFRKYLDVDRLASLAADAYLAWKYGWEPLFRDIYDAVHLVIERMTHGVLKARGVYIENLLETRWYNFRYKRKLDYNRGCEVGLTYKIADADLATLNSLGLINPVSIAWELVPLSFVYDWFIPIGEFLSNATAYKGLEFVTGYRTFFSKGSVAQEDTGYKDSTYKYGTNPVVVSQQERMDRDKLSQFPHVGLQFKHRGLNLNQIGTALALIQQRT